MKQEADTLKIDWDLPENARITRALIDLSAMAEVSSILNSDFWAVVKNINNPYEASKANRRSFKILLSKLKKADLLSHAQGPSAKCIYNNVAALAAGYEPSSPQLQAAMLDNIRWLAEDCAP